jgi:predicted RNA-binding Zn ribbon-like protein
MVILKPAPDVRFGGRAAAGGWLFELSGGHPALDLANTLDERGSARPQERLVDYEALLGFAAQSGVLEAARVPGLAREAARRPAAARACLRRVRALREVLFEVFSAAAAGSPLPEAGLSALNAALARSISGLRLAGGRQRAAWTFETQPGALDPMLGPIVKAAADLLVCDQLCRVRQCPGPDCRWLFLDESRNGSRRWCDMTVCGNRVKVGRHRARQAGSRGPSG